MNSSISLGLVNARHKAQNYSTVLRFPCLFYSYFLKLYPKSLEKKKNELVRVKDFVHGRAKVRTLISTVSCMSLPLSVYVSLCFI